MKRDIRHNAPFLGDDEAALVTDVIKSGLIAQGSTVEEFERAFCRYMGTAGSSCAVSSGTSALFLALYALGVGRGDEVIMPTYVCSALLNAVYMLRATPVPVDVDGADFNISPKEARKAVSKRTKTIIVPHIYGVPADMAGLKKLGVPIIEDCAQAMGSECAGKKAGTIGDVSVFSFFATKLMTTGHGGMVFSKNKGLIEKVRDYRQFDCRKRYYPRFNFQMTDMQAALGIRQLEKLSSFLKRREAIALKYIKALKGKDIGFQEARPGDRRVYYRFVLVRDRVGMIRKAMDRVHVRTIVPVEGWELLHRYLKMDLRRFPVAEMIAASTVSIPVYPALKDGEVDDIVGVLRRL